ncbi:aminodeoxychorismate/anthranilate synthase component II [Aliifodinibius sp. S!AR15-10]|uniref:anthranilate synthase component II n=1 Tax=Aliifodinibius sp. S!AR15-10 TaxID=2950437 RepID=UPI00285C92D2|nr:aminodeoxychorismate/anthranilate synthase component II [Aliifodinibius sp. S!AR15-10]MDR8392336.1 aminodeoxychorismate/anthranilate synthase component II [Aliifodinibius sp. S!AR15-10]
MILIIDNYDSFTYNLVHIVGQQTDDYRVVRNDQLTVEEVEELNPDGILISPGPGRPDEAGITEPVIKALGDRIPVLGVCLGHQAIGEVFGGKVIHAPKLMHGKTSQIYHDGKSIFEGVEDGFTATRYHSLVLDPDQIPEELEVTARSEDKVIMGVRHRKHPIEGIQFHPESILTNEGPKLVMNWLRNTAKVVNKVKG